MIGYCLVPGARNTAKSLNKSFVGLLRSEIPQKNLATINSKGKPRLFYLAAPRGESRERDDTSNPRCDQDIYPRSAEPPMTHRATAKQSTLTPRGRERDRETEREREREREREEKKNGEKGREKNGEGNNAYVSFSSFQVPTISWILTVLCHLPGCFASRQMILS